jgi:hypothetical protein
MWRMDDWSARRLRELEARAPVKRKKAAPFVKTPLWWIEATAKAAKSPTTIILIELLRLRWKTQSDTFPFPSVRLRKLGVSRDRKRRVLQDLEKAGLITVEWHIRKAPVITLIAI